ncbi:MAG: HAMP domain-containing histidine kinase [Planctomycetota bacterium]|nr:HAMP domain-containing histidine kinase [Planctomycetota bacterium]
MNRPWQIWSVFAFSLVVALAAMGVVSHVALNLDRTEAEARLRAAQEENIRLALWRADSALSQVIAQESARPYFAYSSFYATERAYTRMFSEIKHGDILVPSPLLTFESPHIRLHFQIDPEREITSPQVPTGNMRDLSEGAYCSTQRVSACAETLAEISKLLKNEQAWLAQLPEPPVQTVPLAMNPGNNYQGNAYNKKESSWGSRAGKQTQQKLNENELQSRMEQANWASNPQVANSMQPFPPSEAVGEGMMKALWFGEHLILARKVSVNNRVYVQGCWLNYAEIQEWMLGSIQDLLPNARLERDASDESDRDVHRLAALPMRVVPGEVPIQAQANMSPIRWALIVAWICGFLAVLAVAALLWGAVTLSERRGAFVSAVTHELRTPLTTFRMYTEMLAEDMVQDEAQRKTYLQTLRGEAERLGHLVENVLAYAGLERGRYGRHLEDVRAGALLERMRERLDLRARQAGLELTLENAPGAADVPLRVDCAGIERIVFNLVDNACKYASAATDRTLHLRVEKGEGEGGVVVSLRDHGPGVPPEHARKLFRPFSKSAHEAAHSAPGVGLGLALSRRLARSMRGDLRYRAAEPEGARFELILPAAVAASA